MMVLLSYGNCSLFREKPSMALVLWEPPAGSVNPLLSRGGRGQTEEDNNNTSAVDLNSISTPGYVCFSVYFIDCSASDIYLSSESHSDALLSFRKSLGGEACSLTTLHMQVNNFTILEFLATDPEARVRFPALPEKKSSGCGTGSTQPREYN
jgi:hypothetical protein